MARKVIGEKLKVSIVKKFLEGRDAKDLGKIAGVSPQAVRDWARELPKEKPHLFEKKAAAAPIRTAARPAEPPPPPAAVENPPEGASEPEGGAPSVEDALKLEGVKPPEAPPAAPPDEPKPDEPPAGPEAQLPSIIDPEDLASMDDQALVEMVGTIIMGGSTRLGLYVAEWRYKLELDWENPKFDRMFTLTDREIRSLKPCFKFVGPKIRKLIESSEFLSIVAASSVVGMGCLDRYKAITRIAKQEAKAQAAARGKPA